SLGGERQVQQDERVGVPFEAGREHVDHDPTAHYDRLDHQEAAGTEGPGDRLREASEGFGVVEVAEATATGLGEASDAAAHRLPARRRHPDGSTWSRTSSTVTAPTRRPAWSQTGTANRS